MNIVDSLVTKLILNIHVLGIQIHFFVLLRVVYVIEMSLEINKYIQEPSRKLLDGYHNSFVDL